MNVVAIRIRPLVLLLALSVAAASCGRSNKSPGAEETTATPVPEAPAATPALNPPPLPSPVPPIPDGAGQADLDALNQALRQYVRVKKVVPRDVGELVSGGFVRSLPSPPAGKKFVILLHPLGYSVVLEDQ